MAGIAVVLALAAVSCGGDDDGLQKNAEGYKVEPAAEVGPNAFTPSVASTDTQNALGVAPVDGGESAQAAGASACDTTKFLTELQSRPDAYREWAKVLGLKQEQVPAYIKSLKSTVLTSDTKVTNHGLKDGKAYPRASVLTAGTAVLVDASPDGPAASTTSAVPSTTAPGTVVIVTRCKCGNPLLPPPADPEKVDEEAPVTEPPGTTPGSTPGSVAPASTRPTSTGSSTTSTRSATTATTGSSTTTASGGASTTAG